MIEIDYKFVEANKKLVYSIVNKYCNNENFDDLYQVGWTTIIEVSKKFDSSKGIKFSTYAYKHILGAILEYIREDKNLKASRDIIKSNRNIQQYKNEFYITNGRYPSSLEISKNLKIDEYKINDIENICKYEESLDTTLSDDNIPLFETISSKEKISKEDYIALKESLRNLSNEEKKYIYQRYYENKTQTQLAKENNTNQVQMYRYERAILDKLKYSLS